MRHGRQRRGRAPLSAPRRQCPPAATPLPRRARRPQGLPQWGRVSAAGEAEGREGAPGSVCEGGCFGSFGAQSPRGPREGPGCCGRGLGEAFLSSSAISGVLTAFGVPFGPGLLGCMFS